MKLLFSACVVCVAITFVLGQDELTCTKNEDCPACQMGNPHCHGNRLCYCELPIECKGPEDRETCQRLPCNSECSLDNGHYHCECLEEEKLCATNEDCPKCEKGTPHCHDNKRCYCETPIECNGPKDKVSCASLPCDAECSQDHGHFHCECPEDEEMPGKGPPGGPKGNGPKGDGIGERLTCKANDDCPICEVGTRHCHDNNRCYCESPIECNGPEDKVSCVDVPCNAVCSQDHGHFHCECPEDEEKPVYEVTEGSDVNEGPIQE